MTAPEWRGMAATVDRQPASLKRANAAPGSPAPSRPRSSGVMRSAPRIGLPMLFTQDSPKSIFSSRLAK